MYDIERINKIIDDIGRFFRDLESFGYSEKTIADSEKMHARAMVIFGIMNRAIDLAEEVAVKNDVPMPSSYSECFPALAKAGLLEKKLAVELGGVIRQRNLFAHHYYDSEPKKVLKILREVYIVKEFVERIKKLVRKSRS